MTKKIFRSILGAVISVLMVSFLVITGVLYHHFTVESQMRLRDELNLAAEAVELSGDEYLTQLDNNHYRITWVAADGTVLYDTEADVQEMDNHAEREEIKEAFETGNGESSRYSNTLTEKTIYSALRLTNGTVLRISTGMDSVFALLQDVLFPMILIVLLAVVLAIFLARHMAKVVVEPLNELDLEHPMENDVYEELSPMLGKIYKQHQQIAGQMEELKRRTDEFEQITASMKEGLVLLDQKGFVLSMNQAAKGLFQTEEDPVGKDFLVIDRTVEMNHAVQTAFRGKHSEFRAQKNGQEYQFAISPIESDGILIGGVILAFDITEAAFAERNRKEFTANVSHELKTPLQSIIGSAELLENGLVKPEDTSRFVGHIKTEASRLVSLINDIIRLSQLDENREPAEESVDLYAVAKEAVEVLTVAAAKKNVSVQLNGGTCILNGVRRYLYEIVYNLCDNAIRYNVDGGKVTITLNNDQGHAVLSVADTGIGIPAEHHSRIFERFYRVDKSHSKETGGTGLGLSIVKHAVAYHNGKIKLESAEGKGTIITVIF